MFSGDHRPIPLSEYVLCGDELWKVDDTKQKEYCSSFMKFSNPNRAFECIKKYTSKNFTLTFKNLLDKLEVDRSDNSQLKSGEKINTDTKNESLFHNNLIENSKYFSNPVTRSDSIISFNISDPDHIFSLCIEYGFGQSVLVFCSTKKVLFFIIIELINIQKKIEDV
jgi:hypothetical protein